MAVKLFYVYPTHVKLLRFFMLSSHVFIRLIVRENNFVTTYFFSLKLTVKTYVPLRTHIDIMIFDFGGSNESTKINFGFWPNLLLSLGRKGRKEMTTGANI